MPHLILLLNYSWEVLSWAVCEHFSGFSHVWLFAIPWTISARLLCPWDSLGKNTGVGWCALLQGSSWPRDRTCFSCISCIAGGFLTTWETHWAELYFFKLCRRKMEGSHSVSDSHTKRCDVLKNMIITFLLPQHSMVSQSVHSCVYIQIN